MALEFRSFFIGIGTVMAILAVGFGSGVMMGGMISGTQHQPDKVERQAAKDAPAPAAKDASAPPSSVQPIKEAQPNDLNTLARNIDAIKPAEPKSEPASPTQAVTQPERVAPQANASSQVIQPGPPAQDAIAASPQPAAEPQKPLTPAGVAQASPPLGPERQVSLPHPSDETRQLTRREQHRIERAQRREERHRLFAERRQQELQRREEERAAAPRRGFPEIDDDGPPPRRVYMRPRGLFDGLFSSFR